MLLFERVDLFLFFKNTKLCNIYIHIYIYDDVDFDVQRGKNGKKRNAKAIKHPNRSGTIFEANRFQRN